MEPNRKMIEQRPVPPNAWLYEDRGENDRYFTDVVYLPQPDDPTKEPPYWKQCTQAEREEWEEQHKPEEELIANEGCWIVESAKFNDKEYTEKSDHKNCLRVNNPSEYEEVTDAAWQSYCEEYDKRHPAPEPQEPQEV